jgi:hypothetical protein
MTPPQLYREVIRSFGIVVSRWKCKTGRHDWGWFEGLCFIDGMYQRCRKCGCLRGRR